MNYKHFHFLIYFIFFCMPLLKAQKPFVEGSIVYTVNVETAVAGGADAKGYTGSYIVTMKGKQMRKELRMKNGYDDVLIFNFENNTVYSLKTVADKKFAIQLNMDDFVSKAKKYEGYTTSKEDEEKKIAGVAAYKAEIGYRNGNTSVIFLTTEWRPENKIAFERFPDCKFLPLVFDYKNDNGSLFHFQAERVTASPVENAEFRIPADYKLISYSEYQQLSR